MKPLRKELEEILYKDNPSGDYEEEIDAILEVVLARLPERKSQTHLYRLNVVENEFRVARHKAWNSCLTAVKKALIDD